MKNPKVLVACEESQRVYKSVCWEEIQTGDRAKNRSKTFPGIANAMAQQWGDYLLQLED